jgi:putative ABC transport system permease protein
VAHLIATSARSRRRDLATLQALGFSLRQVRAVVLWQGFAMAVATGAIALPVGAIAGRLIWQRYAEGIKVVPEPVTPWSALAALLVASTVLAVVAAGPPAVAASRRRPIDALRSE